MPRKVFLVLLGLTLAGASWAWGQPGHEFGGGGFQDRLMEVKRNQLGPAVGVDQQTVPVPGHAVHTKYPFFIRSRYTQVLTHHCRSVYSAGCSALKHLIFLSPDPIIIPNRIFAISPYKPTKQTAS